MRMPPLYPGTSMETRPPPLSPRSCFPSISGVAAVSSAQVLLPLCLGALTLPVRGQTKGTVGMAYSPMYCCQLPGSSACALSPVRAPSAMGFRIGSPA
jgi:hypothetical protein